MVAALFRSRHGLSRLYSKGHTSEYTRYIHRTLLLLLLTESYTGTVCSERAIGYIRLFIAYLLFLSVVFSLAE